MPPDTPPLVYIVWLDAMASVGWETFDAESEADLVCHTVGWLVHSSDDRYTVAATIGRDGQCNARITIPRGMVLRFSILDCGGETSELVKRTD